MIISLIFELIECYPKHSQGVWDCFEGRSSGQKSIRTIQRGFSRRRAFLEDLLLLAGIRGAENRFIFDRTPE